MGVVFWRPVERAVAAGAAHQAKYVSLERRELHVEHSAHAWVNCARKWGFVLDLVESQD